MNKTKNKWILECNRHLSGVMMLLSFHTLIQWSWWQQTVNTLHIIQGLNTLLSSTTKSLPLCFSAGRRTKKHFEARSKPAFLCFRDLYSEGHSWFICGAWSKQGKGTYTYLSYRQLILPVGTYRYSQRHSCNKANIQRLYSQNGRNLILYEYNCVFIQNNRVFVVRMSLLYL